MVTVAIILFVVCLGVFIYSVIKQKPGLAAISLSAVFCLPVIGILICGLLSMETLPNGYEPVPSYSIIENEVTCSMYVRAKYNDCYYVRSDLGQAWWIPGSATNYEKLPSLEGIFCEDCGVFCSLDYCVLCGAHLKDSDCTHWESRNMPYCGECGKQIEKEEK